MKADVRKMAEDIFESERERQRKELGDEFNETIWRSGGAYASYNIGHIERVLHMLSYHWGRIPAKRVPEAIQLITMIAERRDAAKHQGS